MAALDIPDLVRRRAASSGAGGHRWLDALPEVVATLADRWQLEIGPSFRGGTAAFVAEVTDASGQPCVLKVAMPIDDNEIEMYRRSVLVHQIAGGQGCAMLLDHDESLTAMLLERLGPNLDELGASVTEMMAAIASTLASFWQPVGDDCDLPTGAWQAQWLAQLITRTWTDLGPPCDRRVVDRALAYCDERAAAFDPHTSVLVHGDAHGWNTLAAGSDTYKFVDPEGLRSERAHDLAVPMREYNEPLLAGDTPRLVRERAELLASLAGVDVEPVWQWGFIERVSTGLVNIRDFGADSGGEAFLAVAERCL